MASRPLADYVEPIYFRGQDVSNASNRPFKGGKPKNTPLLLRRGVNRILLFPGSFNPPHRGHLQLLQHAFENARDDLGIVAAIIIITDDDRLRDKLSGEENAITFSKEQRAKLWRFNIETLDWAWVYDVSEVGWETMRPELIRNAKKDGMDVKFILLGGPDSVGAERRIDPRRWQCADLITSDISRPVDFRYPNSLRQLSGFSMWEKPKVDSRILETRVKTRLQGSPDTGASKQDPATCCDKLTILKSFQMLFARHWLEWKLAGFAIGFESPKE